MIKLLPSRYIRTLLGLVLGIVTTSLIIFVAPAILRVPAGAHAISWLNPTNIRIHLALGAFAMFFGLPSGILVHSLLYIINRRSVISYIGAGFFAGCLLKFVMGFHLDVSLFVFGIWAAGIAAIFWLIRRPDLDGKRA